MAETVSACNERRVTPENVTEFPGDYSTNMALSPSCTEKRGPLTCHGRQAAGASPKAGQMTSTSPYQETQGTDCSGYSGSTR
jgi:hypothetical protein